MPVRAMAPVDGGCQVTRVLPAWALDVAIRLAPKPDETPLYWAEPPGALLRELYIEARRSVPYTGGHQDVDSAISRQTYLRKVSVEYGKVLARERIFVEGETDLEDSP